MYGNGHSMPIMLDHRSTAQSEITRPASFALKRFKVLYFGPARHDEKRDFFYFIFCIDVIKRSKVKTVRVKGQGQRSRSLSM